MLATVMLAGTRSVPAEATPSATRTKINIEAPDDVFVVSISAASGPVKSGDLLFTLKSLRVSECKDHLAVLKDQILICERPFTDGRVKEQIEMLKRKAEDFSKLNDIAQDLLKMTRQRYEVGGASPKDIDDAMSAAFSAHSRFLDVELSAKQVERKKKDAQDKVELAKAKLAYHQKNLSELENAMTVKCGQTGTFNATTVIGAFVKKGHLLGTIEV